VVFAAVLVLMISFLRLYLATETDNIVKATLIILTLYLVYDMPLFHVVRTQYFETLDPYIIVNYKNVIGFVPVIIGLLETLVFYILEFRFERNIEEI
jgi:hypothetical protein